MGLSNSDQKEIDETLKDDSALDTTSNKVAALDGSYFKDNLNVGLEELTPDDLPTPKIAMIAATSKIRDEKGRPYIPGQFYYSGLKKVYDELYITMLCYTKQDLPAYEDKNILVKNYVFFGAIEEDGEILPFKWYLSKTGAGSAKQLLGDVKAYRMPMFALKIKATSSLINGEKNDYYKVKFTIIGVHDDPEKIITLENLAKTYAPKAAEDAKNDNAEELQPIKDYSEDIPF